MFTWARIIGNRLRRKVVRKTSLMAATVVMPDGRKKAVGVVDHPSAVAVVAIAANAAGDPEVLLLRQQRPVVGKEALIEVVGGKIEPGENPRTAAERELAEEAGKRASVWIELGRDLLPAPDFLIQRVHSFVALDLTDVPPRKEDADNIVHDWTLWKEAIRQVVACEIKTMPARDALLTAEMRRQEWQKLL
jgi:ADP-ribose pyrophosphatase